MAKARVFERSIDEESLCGRGVKMQPCEAKALQSGWADSIMTVKSTFRVLTYLEAVMPDFHLPPQSPIDLGYARPITLQLPPEAVTLEWGELHNGQVCKGKYGPEITFEKNTSAIKGNLPGKDEPTSFGLDVFHFHHKSEHRVNGRRWPCGSPCRPQDNRAGSVEPRRDTGD